MSENSTHVIVHHIIDNLRNFNFMTVNCCIILLVVFVSLVLLILIIIIFYLVRRKCLNSKMQGVQRSTVTPNTSIRLLGQTESQNLDGISSCGGVSNPFPTVDDENAELSSNRQDIPLSNLRNGSFVVNRPVASSESSAGLYDVLFPVEPEGEVIYKPPKKLVTFAGHVFKTAIRDSSPYLRPSTSHSGATNQNFEAGSDSLAWDYFDSKYYNLNGEAEDSESARSSVVNVCWV